MPDLTVEQQAIVDLQRQVTELKDLVGRDHLMSPRMSAEEIAANRPPETPSGDYNLAYRTRQIGISQDEIVSRMGFVDAAMVKINAEMTAQRQVILEMAEEIEDLRAELPANSSGGVPIPAGATVIEGDFIVKGRLGIGGLEPDCAAKVHILSSPESDGGAAIQMVSNRDGSQYQNSRPHYALMGLSADGGTRIQQNCKHSISKFEAYDPGADLHYMSSNRDFMDPTRETAYIGFDSRGNLSLMRAEPGKPHEYTQDVVFMLYEDQKIIGIESWRPGWNFKFGVSPAMGQRRWTPTLV